MSNKFLLGIAAAFFAVFVIGIGAVVGITKLSDHTTISDVNATVAPTPQAHAKTFAIFTPDVQDPNRPSAPAVALVSAGADKPVTLADINQLAVAVKLGTQNTGDISRDVWAKETPIAEHFLNGMCDCDQRNWLVHFIKTGNEALSGSENYYQSVQLLATLRRGNDELSSNAAAR